MCRFELLVLDMAGTTVDDGGVVATVFARTLERFAIDPGPDGLAPHRGASKHEVLRHFLEARFGPGDETNQRVDGAVAGFDAALADAYGHGPIREVPGASAMLRELRGRGHRCALNSGFSRALVDVILDRLGWTDLVDATVAGDEVARGRPAPYLIFRAMELTGVVDVRRVMAIGDTRLDLRAGANAGCGAVVGVLSGAHDLDQLGREPYTHLLPSVAALVALIDAVDPRPRR